MKSEKGKRVKTEKTGKKANRKLGRRIIAVQSILIGIMAIVLIVVSYRAFRQTYLKFYSEKAQDIVNIVADQTDWEKLEHYVETGEDDEYSIELKNYYNRVKVLFDRVDYLYLFVPGEDSFTFIIEAQRPGDDLANIASYGDVFKYTKHEYEKLVPDIKAGKPSTGIMTLKSDVAEGLEVWTPVFDKDGNLRAMVEADYILADITRDLNSFVFSIILVILISVASMAFFSFFYLRHNVMQPIGALTHSVDSYEHGELEVDWKAFPKKDELWHLASSFGDMTKRIETYNDEVNRITATKEHLAAEFNIAKDIQQTLLPCQFPAFPERSDFDIYAELHSCDAIGGNFYNFFLTENNRLCIFFGNVSGNGIPTSMFSIIATTLISNYASQNLSPDKILSYTNNELVKSNNDNFEVDVFLALVDMDTGKLSYATAGNMNVLLKSPGSNFEPLPLKKCFPLAAMAQVQYITQHIDLSQGDILFLHSKGITEATNSKGLIMGSDYVKEMITTLVGLEYSLDKLTKKIFQRMDDFQEGSTQIYDSSVLLFRYIGK